MTSLKKFLQKKGYSCIPLSRTATDHLEIRAKLNGVQGRFIVDTGASNTCIGLEVSDKFNLDSQESKIKAAGAGAIDMETLVSKNNQLKLDSIRLKKIDIVLIDLSHVNHALTSNDAKAVDGIIGADVLRKCRAVIDYKKDALFLKNRKKTT